MLAGDLADVGRADLEHCRAGSDFHVGIGLDLRGHHGACCSGPGRLRLVRILTQIGCLLELDTVLKAQVNEKHLADAGVMRLFFDAERRRLGAEVVATSRRSRIGMSSSKSATWPTWKPQGRKPSVAAARCWQASSLPCRDRHALGRAGRNVGNRRPCHWWCRRGARDFVRRVSPGGPGVPPRW